MRCAILWYLLVIVDMMVHGVAWDRRCTRVHTRMRVIKTRGWSGRACQIWVRAKRAIMRVTNEGMSWRGMRWVITASALVNRGAEVLMFPPGKACGMLKPKCLQPSVRIFETSRHTCANLSECVEGAMGKASTHKEASRHVREHHSC